VSENIEAEVKLLIRQVSEQVTQCGGMNRQTYDALSAASATLSSEALASGRRGACGSAPCHEGASPRL
jgi:hypothetical protein